MMNPLAIDETGNFYGKLLVLRRAGSNRHHQAMWLCNCLCGRRTTVAGNDLRGGKSKSCGCLRGPKPTRNALLEKTDD
jgi:hypothetical protein